MKSRDALLKVPTFFWLDEAGIYNNYYRRSGVITFIFSICLKFHGPPAKAHEKRGLIA